MRERNFQREPKPFIFINLEKVQKEKFKSLDKFYGYNGKMEFHIIVKSNYLYVGSGSYDFKDNIPYYSFYRCNNKIAIPGSSLKGAIRVMLEALSNSCVSVRKKEELNEKFRQCKFDEEKPEKDKLCPACSIFGTTGYAGRVSFSDAYPVQRINTKIVKIGELFPPKINYQKRKFYQHKKFIEENLKPERNTRFVEAISQNSIFKFKLNFINLEESEISLLFYSMGLFQDYYIKLGGAKPRCFGTVEIKPIRIELNTLSKLREENQREIDNIEAWCKEIMNNIELLNEKALKEYKEKTNKFDKNCPRRNY